MVGAWHATVCELSFINIFIVTHTIYIFLICIHSDTFSNNGADILSTMCTKNSMVCWNVNCYHPEPIKVIENDCHNCWCRRRYGSVVVTLCKICKYFISNFDRWASTLRIYVLLKTLYENMHNKAGKTLS